MDLIRLTRTLNAFDAENAQDPHSEIVAGKSFPKELLYAQRMSDILKAYVPDAPETITLAARCQHIRRWEIQRESFPADRKGYLMWRSKLKEMHARLAGEIMLTHGYGQDTIKQVSNLLVKKNLKSDPEVQILEDVVCIVFLKYYFHDFASKHDDEKIKNILLKTMRKMSAEGIEYAKKLQNADLFLKYVT